MNHPSEAQIHFELYYHIRTQFPHLTVHPEHRFKRLHHRGTVRADLYIPDLRLIIEVKNHSGYAKREVQQLHEYQALQQMRGYQLLYCRSLSDVSLVLQEINERLISTIGPPH